MEGSTLPLNRFESMFLAMSDVMDTSNQVYLVRLEGALATDRARETCRELAEAFPRMRAVLEPGFGAWRLRVLEDRAFVDVLFEDAFRVLDDFDVSDAVALLRLHTELLNDPLPLKRGLPFRVVFLPHPQTPVLLLSVHHLVCDGRSMVQMLTALFGAFRGEPIAPQPLEDPSPWPSIMPPRLREWPRALVRSFETLVEGTRLTTREGAVTLNGRRGIRFATTGLRHFDAPCPAHRIRRAAKARGTTVNTLMNAAVATAFLATRPDDPDAVALLRMAVDLRRAFPEDRRPTFGNFVTTFVVEARAGATVDELVASVDRQCRWWLERIDRHELCATQLLAEAQSRMGRGPYAWALNRARSTGRLLRESAQTSNIGNGDRLFNPEGATLRVVDIRASVPNALTQITLVELSDQLMLTVSYRREDMDERGLDALLGNLERILLDWTAEDGRPTAGDQSSTTP